MKKVFLISCYILMIYSCTAQSLNFEKPFENKIYLPDGITLINPENLSKLLNERYLREDKVSISYNEFSLHQESESSMLLLIGKSDDNNIKTAVNVELSKDKYIISKVTLTCRGCNRGCNPSTDEKGEPYCTMCEGHQGNDHGCEKTVTTTQEPTGQ